VDRTRRRAPASAPRPALASHMRDARGGFPWYFCILVNMTLFSLSLFLAAENLEASCFLAFFPCGFSFAFPANFIATASGPALGGSVRQVQSSSATQPGPAVANHCQHTTGRMPCSAELPASGESVAAAACSPLTAGHSLAPSHSLDALLVELEQSLCKGALL